MNLHHGAMARSHAKLLCKVWQDPDWCSLKPREQWAYTLLLSQPRLSLVGCLDFMPGRWTTFGQGLTVDYINVCLDGLEDAQFVCVDRQTQEVLVRSFTRHDGIPITNERLRKGLWGAYEAVTSVALRRVAVDNMPEDLFDYEVPDEADHFRRSGPMEWVIERPMQHPIEQATDSPVPCSLSPVTYHQPPTTVDSPQKLSTDFEHHPTARIPDELREQNLAAIAALKADRFGETA